MIAVSGQPAGDAFRMTLRQLLIVADERAAEHWDHTAVLTSDLKTLAALVHNAFHKQHKVKPPSPQECHPLRGKERTGLRITPQNFTALRGLVGALSARPAQTPRRRRRR